MGNRCYVCDEKNCNEYITVSGVDNGKTVYDCRNVLCHQNCRPICDKCGEIYHYEKWMQWTNKYTGIIHICVIPRKCTSCNLRGGCTKRVLKKKMICWHERCEPSDQNWPICDETNIVLRFHLFPREYRKYMLFQYWALRNIIRDKNIVWKIVTFAVYPYGYATHIQNGIPMDQIHPSCKCGELKQYLTNYTPRCINGCVYNNIDRLIQLVNNYQKQKTK